MILGKKIVLRYVSSWESFLTMVKPRVIVIKKETYVILSDGKANMVPSSSQSPVTGKPGWRREPNQIRTCHKWNISGFSTQDQLLWVVCQEDAVDAR